jgi:hypothetical protein
MNNSVLPSRLCVTTTHSLRATLTIYQTFEIAVSSLVTANSLNIDCHQDGLQALMDQFAPDILNLQGEDLLLRDFSIQSGRNIFRVGRIN